MNMPVEATQSHGETFSGVRTQSGLRGICALTAYVACVYGANLAISTFGIIRLWPLPLYAPAGVLFVGVAFSARDWLQETLGRRWTILGILIGAALSAFLSPALAVASATAFLASETADLLVYSPLRAKHRAWAVTLSNTVGAVVDSALFLWLAFGSLAFFWGQVIGKELMVAPALIVLALIRWRKRIREEQRDLHVVKRITALMEAERDTVLDDLEQQVDAAIARRKAGA